MKWLRTIHIDWSLLKNITLVLVVQRLIFFLIGFFADNFVPFQPSYPYFESLLKPFGPEWFVKWGGFDGVHYLTIVEKGYVGTGLIQAFFPLYPLLIRLLSTTFYPIVSGMLLSTTCFIGAMYMWVLMMRDKKIQIPWWMMLLPWLVFPTSLFFGALYTESLFLLLVFLSVLNLQRKHIFLASIFAGLVSATRVVGIMLVPFMLLHIFLEWWPKRSHLALPLKHLAISLIGATGLLSFMVYLYKTFQDPLFFLHVQEEFGAGRSEKIVLLPQVLYRYIKILFTTHEWTWSYYAYAQELVVTSIVFSVLLYLSLKHWKKMLPELVFSWGVFIIPTLTGTLQSMPRYVLAVFPLFIFWNVLGKSKPRVYWLLCGISACFLLLNIILFVQGKWVA